MSGKDYSNFKLQIMKKSISSIVLFIALIALHSSNAQVKLSNKIKKDALQPKLPQGTVAQLKAPLDFATIKQQIDNGKACYTLSAVVAYLEPSGNEKKPPKQAYSTSTGFLKSESNYLRMNALLLLSKKSFSRAAGNTFEVILMPSGNKINLNNIKVTWRFERDGLRTFLLENVQITYSKTGITFTGHKTVDGKQLVFSFAIAEITCLI